VGVAAVVLKASHEEVVLIQRAAEPARGSWSFPGGLVRAGETIRDACVREVREETGLDVKLRDVAKVVERIIHDEQGRVEYHYLIVDFWATVRAGELAPSSDALDARWVSVADVRAYETTRGVPEAIDRAILLARGGRPSTVLFEG
jgi:ADP-ribose pyrophosphatase YjhB (NUDIX family)